MSKQATNRNELSDKEAVTLGIIDAAIYLLGNSSNDRVVSLDVVLKWLATIKAHVVESPD